MVFDGRMKQGKKANDKTEDDPSLCKVLFPSRAFEVGHIRRPLRQVATYGVWEVAPHRATPVFYPAEVCAHIPAWAAASSNNVNAQKAVQLYKRWLYRHNALGLPNPPTKRQLL